MQPLLNDTILYARKLPVVLNSFLMKTWSFFNYFKRNMQKKQQKITKSNER